LTSSGLLIPLLGVLDSPFSGCGRLGPDLERNLLAYLTNPPDPRIEDTSPRSDPSVADGKLRAIKRKESKGHDVTIRVAVL